MFLFTLVSSLTLFAANDTGQQLWLDINPRWYSKDAIKITGVFGVRQSLNQKEWTRYVMKPSLAYSFNQHVNITAGLGVNYTDNIDVGSVVIDDRLAIIPFQGISYFHFIMDKWKMNYYFRVEEKFDYETAHWESRNSLRLRLRIRTMYEFDAYQSGRYYRATLSWEGFKTATGEDGFITDKSRVTVGLERSFNHNQKGRIELTWQRQSLGLVSGDEFNDYSDIYLRIRYYPSWGDVIKNKFWHAD